MGTLLMTNNNEWELPEVWYHGTDAISARDIALKVDLSKSEAKLDFGPGFYLTSNLKQAEKWAEKKADLYNFRQDTAYEIHGKTPSYTVGAVVEFQLQKEIFKTVALKREVTVFLSADDMWAMFVLANRLADPDTFHLTFHNQKASIDSVYGPLADGRNIRRLVKSVENGTMSTTEFIDLISTGFKFPKNNQLSIHTEEALFCLFCRGVKEIESEKYA